MTRGEENGNQYQFEKRFYETEELVENILYLIHELLELSQKRFIIPQERLLPILQEVRDKNNWENGFYL